MAVNLWHCLEFDCFVFNIVLHWFDISVKVDFSVQCSFSFRFIDFWVEFHFWLCSFEVDYKARVPLCT